MSGVFTNIVTEEIYEKRESNNGHIACHYANRPMQYTAIFHGRKNVTFLMKNLIFFLIFAQNIDCGYMLEPPQ